MSLLKDFFSQLATSPDLGLGCRSVLQSILGEVEFGQFDFGLFRLCEERIPTLEEYYHSQGQRLQYLLGLGWVRQVREGVYRLGVPYPTPGRGWVYVIESGGLVKIGLSTDIDQRLRGFSTSLPDLTLLAEYDCIDCAAVEKSLHDFFQEHRTHGEWFSGEVGSCIGEAFYDVFQKFPHEQHVVFGLGWHESEMVGLESISCYPWQPRRYYRGRIDEFRARWARFGHPSESPREYQDFVEKHNEFDRDRQWRIRQMRHELACYQRDKLLNRRHRKKLLEVSRDLDFLENLFTPTHTATTERR